MLSENNRGARVAQPSPWYDPAAYDPVAEFIKRIQLDADRLDAVAADDATFFEAHPERNFHLRAATPHERDTVIAYDMVLVSHSAPGLRLRIPLACSAPPCLREAILASVPEYDTEERAAATFDRIAPHYIRASTPRGLYRIIQELRRRRRAVSRRKK
jgi:hypothetical protein